MRCPEHKQLWLVYGRTYTPRAGFNYSETNQLILSLKASPAARDYQLKHKHRAILRFADELREFLSRYPEAAMVLVPMPPSKALGDPEYDDRIDKVAHRVADSLSNVSCAPLLYQTVSVPSSAQNPDFRRTPEQIYQNFSINEAFASYWNVGVSLMVVDDVLTSGAHFAAARRRLSDRFPQADIRGIFWAKASNENT